MRKKTHMTDAERAMIASGINAGKSFRQIADEIGKSQTTVSREILKHRASERKGCFGKPFNDCGHAGDCPVSKGCGDNHCSKRACAGCRRICGSGCRHYMRKECPRLSKPPYVCGPCPSRSRCTLEKMGYSPVIAQKEYKDLLSDSRKVLHASEEEVEMIDEVLHRGLSQGQSINHIYTYAGPQMPVSQRTCYDYINSGVLRKTIRLDQPKAVRMRKRSPKKAKQGADPERKRFIGRTYADYLVFREGNPDMQAVVEMDCVEGRKGGNGRVLLTLLFNPSSLQIAFVLERHTSECVVDCLRRLRLRLGTEMYKRLFPLILTDRGSEFSDIRGMEMDEQGDALSRVFFCDGDAPEQKGRCERNHAEIRRILPKGSDISFAQDKADLIMSHINSAARPALNNRSAYAAFVFFFGQDAADALGLKEIDARDINLTPGLLK